MFTKRASLWMLVVIVIVGTISGVAQAQDEETSPEAAVEALYGEYLGYFYQSETEPTFPVEGWYRENELLTADFIAEIDAFEDRYDPFLCAQNTPTAFLVEDAELGEDAAAASVVVRTNFANFHAFEVELVQDGDAWLIDGVNCMSVEQDPAGVVKQFYLIFLSYMAWDGEDERPNFFVDQAYNGTPLLSDDFVAELDALRESRTINYDPIICAQDVPESIDVVEVEEKDGAAVVTVESSFEGHSFAVELEQDDEAWVITGITCTLD